MLSSGLLVDAGRVDAEVGEVDVHFLFLREDAIEGGGGGKEEDEEEDEDEDEDEEEEEDEEELVG